MGLNGIRNPAKLRKIAALIGEPCEYAASRYFEHQDDLIAFGASGSVFVVNLKRRAAEPYQDQNGRILTPYRDKDGRCSGVSSSPQAIR
jgi:hypothetical protein